MIRYGLIGVGSFGSFIYKSLLANHDLVLYTFVERDQQKALKYAKEFHVTTYYTDVEDMITDPKVDIVVIATPPYTHTDLAIQALQQKKAVFLEKPPCISLDEIQRLMHAQSETHGKITVDLVMRYNPLAQLVRSLVQDEILQHPKRIAFNNFASDAALPEDHWFWDRTKSGGILVEHGLHFFDLYAWMLGIHAMDCSSIAARTKHPNAIDSVLATILYEKEIFGSYYHTFTMPQEYQQALIGFENAYVMINGWIPTDVYITGNFSPEAIKKHAPMYGCLIDNSFVSGNHEKEALHITTSFSRQELYQQSVRRGFEDLIHAYTNRSYTQQVQLVDALQANLTAIAARDTLSKEIFLKQENALKQR